MLVSLFGNPSIEKILLFLLVNETCYATQLSRHLQSPLTPIQKALARLEKGGIVIYNDEGKTRLYRFNPSCPLVHELELLLQKGFAQLSPQDKKRYYSSKGHHSPSLKRANLAQEVLAATVLDVWKRLNQVNHLSFSAKSKSPSKSGWHGVAKGNVVIKRRGEHTLLFHEEGSWTSETGQSFDFHNVFRWTLDPVQSMISLEHLRHGPDRPVFLFHLAPVAKHRLESLHSHSCGEDTYFGRIHCDPHFLQLNWRIIGAKKNEHIDYLYT